MVKERNTVEHNRHNRKNTIDTNMLSNVLYVPNVVKKRINTVGHNRKNTIDTIDFNVISNVLYVPNVVKK